MTSRSRTVVTLALGTLMASAGAPLVRAQVPTAAEPLTPAPFLIRRPPADLDLLTELYNIGDWVGLQRKARDIICVARENVSGPAGRSDVRPYDESCEAGPGTSPVAEALDLRRADVAVMWVGADAFGNVRLMRIVVSRSDRLPYALDLPGLAEAGERRLSEMFLSRSPGGRVTSLYTSTREVDPLLAQLPAFGRALAGPLFATVGTIAGATPEGVGKPGGEAERPKLSATVTRVSLPFPRASIRLQAVAREPATTAAFAAAADRLAGELAFAEVPRAPCARGLAATLAADLPLVTQADQCSAATSGRVDCLAAFDAAVTTRFDAAVDACESGRPSRDALKAMEVVDERFRALVQTITSTEAVLDLTFRNRPPTHFSLGAGAGVIAAASLSRARVETRSGIIVADPLDRVLTMAFVNWSPAGYDEKDPSIAPAERIRPFFGAALTPDFGPAIGVNVLLARGIGITAGGALLFGRGADPADIGLRPAQPSQPYKLAVARAAFVGIGYSYK